MAEVSKQSMSVYEQTRAAEDWAWGDIKAEGATWGNTFDNCEWGKGGIAIAEGGGIISARYVKPAKTAIKATLDTVSETPDFALNQELDEAMTQPVGAVAGDTTHLEGRDFQTVNAL